jgi:hypothetical protein
MNEKVLSMGERLPLPDWASRMAVARLVARNADLSEASAFRRWPKVRNWRKAAHVSIPCSQVVDP